MSTHHADWLLDEPLAPETIHTTRQVLGAWQNCNAIVNVTLLYLRHKEIAMATRSLLQCKRLAHVLNGSPVNGTNSPQPAQAAEAEQAV